MNYIYETIEHSSKVPIKIFTQTVSSFPYHWHEDCEVLFVLKGEVVISVENVKNHLYEGNVFVVNSNALHFIDAVSMDTKAELLVLQFDINHFRRYDLDVSQLQFDLSYEKKGTTKRKAYDQVRGLLASMMKVVINNEEPMQLVIERHLLDLIIVLINNFTSSKDYKVADKTGDKRVIEIIKYIDSNCKDCQLGLEGVAENFHLSSRYLSRYFKSEMGVSLKKFLDNMRMNKSLHALKSSDERIIDIAIRHGFPDAKAYYRVFKETMGMTPSQYRTMNRIDIKKEVVADYFSTNTKETLAKLFEYVDAYNHNVEYQKIKMNTFEIFTNKTLRPVPSAITKLMTFGSAPHGLRSDFEAQLTDIQAKVGFEYVRFHNIFSDELLFFNLRSDGSVYYNYNHIDRLFDVLLKHGLKPFLELGFMPKALASGNQTVFYNKTHTSPPKNMSLWADMINDFMKHIINRYGREEILTWYFEFWNEPEFKLFFNGTEEEFYQLFKTTYRVIKTIDNRLQVGGFGTMNFISGKKWLERFAKQIINDGIMLDFYSFHIYQTSYKEDIEEGDLDISNPILDVEYDESINVALERIKDGNMNVSLGNSEGFTQSVDDMIAVNRSFNFSKENYYITEWNASPNCRDLVHDTCYMASYIVKSVLDNAFKVLGMGFWTATDIFEEFRLEQPLFHGGFGLLTYNGIKKPSFHAYTFLSELVGDVVYQEEGILVTKKQDNYQIILYNYVHYNDLYKNFDISQISMTSRYDVFKGQKSIDSVIKLKDVYGEYVIETKWVNRKKGSAYDAWVEMGAPEEISQSALEYLKSASETGYKIQQVASGKELEVNCHLEPHEIQLISIKKRL